MKFPRFLAGLLFGVLIGLIIWYWQKSTSSEEGALAVLDRLAEAELRVRDLEARLRLAEKPNREIKPTEVLSGLSDLWGIDKVEESRDQGEMPELKPSAETEEKTGQIGGTNEDDLKLINGIGPAYEKRLKEAGVLTFADLINKTPAELREITGLKPWQASNTQQWIAAAQDLLQG